MKEEIASARAYFEKAERESDPELKAQALEEALVLLASLDPDEISQGERTLIANLRLAHTRRMLAQLVRVEAMSMDAWLGYVRLIFGDLRPEVERLIESDAGLRENYAKFTGLWGHELAEILRTQQRDSS
jgi:hypothetical protein